MDSDSDTDFEELSKLVAKSLQELPYSDSSDVHMENEQNQDKESQRRTEQNEEYPRPGPRGVPEPQPGPGYVQNPPEILEDQAGASNVNEISNISIDQEIGSVENDNFTVKYLQRSFLLIDSKYQPT